MSFFWVALPNLCLWIQSRTPGVEEFAVDYAGAA